MAISYVVENRGGETFGEGQKANSEKHDKLD
jgi:hypothetical protein